MSGRASVLVIDDHPVWRSALAALINAGDALEVTCEAASMDEARVVAARQDFDLVTVDVSLPDGSGLDLIAGPVADGAEARRR